jgi:hypothetical protein
MNIPCHIGNSFILIMRLTYRMDSQLKCEIQTLKFEFGKKSEENKKKRKEKRPKTRPGLNPHRSTHLLFSLRAGWLVYTLASHTTPWVQFVSLSANSCFILPTSPCRTNRVLCRWCRISPTTSARKSSWANRLCGLHALMRISALTLPGGLCCLAGSPSSRRGNGLGAMGS